MSWGCLLSFPYSQQRAKHLHGQKHGQNYAQRFNYFFNRQIHPMCNVIYILSHSMVPVLPPNSLPVLSSKLWAFFCFWTISTRSLILPTTDSIPRINSTTSFPFPGTAAAVFLETVTAVPPLSVTNGVVLKTTSKGKEVQASF